MNNFHNIKQKIIKNCTVSHTSVLNDSSGSLLLNAFILYKIAKSHTCGVPGQK